MAAKKKLGILERTEAGMRARGISQAKIDEAKERLARQDAAIDAKMPRLEQVTKRWLVERQAEVIANEPFDSSARQQATASLMKWLRMLTDKVEHSGEVSIVVADPYAKERGE